MSSASQIEEADCWIYPWGGCLLGLQSLLILWILTSQVPCTNPSSFLLVLEILLSTETSKCSSGWCCRIDSTPAIYDKGKPCFYLIILVCFVMDTLWKPELICSLIAPFLDLVGSCPILQLPEAVSPIEPQSDQRQFA